MFLYFFPSAKAVTAAQFRAAGLDYALEPDLAILNRQVLQHGPDGNGGLVSCVGQGDLDLGYYPDRQTWRKIPGQEVWVGMFREPPPGPDDLARRRQLLGHPVELADGRQWLVPVARRFVEAGGQFGWCCRLPTRSVLGDDGRWQEGEVLEAYRRLWQIACDWDQALTDSQKEETARGTVMGTFDFEGVHEKALEILAVNYRLGPAEADLLGLLTEEHSIQILHATIDMPTRLEWVKKKLAAAPAGMNTAPGAAES